MNIFEIDAADGQARGKFTYKPDGATDNWRSHADEVLAGTPWEGDCDDLASTVLDLCGRQGVPLEDRYRLLVSSTGGKLPDHMVGCVRGSDGAFRLVGDTFRAAYDVTSMAHKGIVYNRLSENPPHVAETIWREGVPWKVDV